MLDLTKFQGVQHIFDEIPQEKINRLIGMSSEDLIWTTNHIHLFLEKYLSWISSTKNNRLKGLDRFPYRSFSNGTTESFDKFYIRHRDRKITVLKDEYLYHRLYAEAKDVELIGLNKNSAVILSAPFCRTGDIHPLTEEILTICDEKNIPVLIDSAYYGLCGDLEFNFDHPCIEDIAFSLSKPFGVSYLRIGMRLSKVRDSLVDFSQSGYVSRLSAKVGEKLLDDFGPDYLYTKYRQTQLNFCAKLNIDPSPTVIFGVDNHNRYPAGEQRLDEKNRFCFSKYLHSNTLP